MFEEAAGADGVIEAVPVLVVGVVAPHQDVLVARVVRSLVDDPGPPLHADGVASANVGAELGAVAAALVAVALEVLVLVEVDLQPNQTLSHSEDTPRESTLPPPTNPHTPRKAFTHLPCALHGGPAVSPHPAEVGAPDSRGLAPTLTVHIKADEMQRQWILALSCR